MYESLVCLQLCPITLMLPNFCGLIQRKDCSFLTVVFVLFHLLKRKVDFKILINSTVFRFIGVAEPNSGEIKAYMDEACYDKCIDFVKEDHQVNKTLYGFRKLLF